MMLLFVFILTVFADADSQRQCVVDCAKNQIGKPYSWDTYGPDTFDSSGLIWYCYNDCGYEWPYVADSFDLMEMGTQVTRDKLVLGDIVCPYAGQVEIYSGNGNTIFARGAEGYVVEKAIEYVYVARRLISGGDETPDPGNNDNNNDNNNNDNNDNNNNDNNNGETVVWVDSDSVATVLCEVINVRAGASTSTEAVAEYYQGNTFYYDSIVTNSECAWFSYIGNSGNRRYVCAKTPSGQCYLSPCP